MSANSFGVRSSLEVGGTTYEIFRIDMVAGHDRLPYSLKILPENLLRTEDGVNITADDTRVLGSWDAGAEPSHEIQFTPARVIVQDSTGVPCVVDLATMGEAVTTLGGDPARVNPLSPVETAIGRPVTAEVFGTPAAFARSTETEAAMPGQPVSMFIPRVVGFKLIGRLPEGITSTDLVLTITEILRRHKVVGKFVEFYGEGVSQVSLANRATIGNTNPEHGLTIAVFPTDRKTIDYLRLTGHDETQIALVEAYAKAQGLWYLDDHEPDYSEYIELNLRTVVPSIAGPKHPQDRILFIRPRNSFREMLSTYIGTPDASVPVTLADGTSLKLRNGVVTVTFITSCIDTSNPPVMLGATLVAKKAVERGMTRRPWAKTSLAPGSQATTDYYIKSGLGDYLDAIEFSPVGYGCVTCVSNTGLLIPRVSVVVNEHDLVVAAMLSGSRNFGGRVSPDAKMNYLVSPMPVIIYAPAGTMDIDLFNDPIGQDHNGNDVFIRSLWPTQAEIEDTISSSTSPETLVSRYADVFTGDERWRSLPTPSGAVSEWDEESTYVRRAPYPGGMSEEPIPVEDIGGVRVLLKLGDPATTDHIFPARSIKPDPPAGAYPAPQGVGRRDFNSYGSRRGGHEIMIRGIFANIRSRSQAASGTEGGFTRDFTLPGVSATTVYDAAQNYAAAGIPLVILVGKEYGSGSSRDWVTEDTALFGVRVVAVESYERIHRSNLIGMGVLPLQFPGGISADSFGLTGERIFTVPGIIELNSGITPRTARVTATRPDGTVTGLDVIVRVDTPGEWAYYLNDGIMLYVLRNLARA